jgi:inner membrane protein
MASFGHLAVGLLAGRLQDDGRAPGARTSGRAATLLGFGLLALLPDADVLLMTLGVGDDSVAGHRGASHSLLTAIAIAVAGGVLARRYGWNGLRTGLAVMLAIGSHGLLDALGQGGRAIPLLWPLSDQRFMAPWRCLPDAPRGMKFLSRHGLFDAVLEFFYFLPITAFALWPRLAARVPRLAVVAGGTLSEPASLAGIPPLVPLAAKRIAAQESASADADSDSDADSDGGTERASLRSSG